MKKQNLEPISVKLRNKYQSFEKYVHSQQLSNNSLSQTSSQGKFPTYSHKPQSSFPVTSLTSRDFKTRAFTHVAEDPLDLISRSRFFKAKSTQNLTSRSAKQYCSTIALHEGVKCDSNSQYTHEKIKEVKEELLQEDEDHVDIEEFISSLWILNELGFDLRLTYDLARAEEVEVKEVDELGFYFNVQQTLKQVMQKKMGEDVETTEFEVLETVDKFMKFVREAIRCVRRKGDKDTGIIVEMIFRCFVKLIDSIYRIHSNNIESLKSEHLNSLNMQKISRAVELNKLQEQMNSTTAQLKEEISELHLKIKILEDESLRLNDDIVEKEIKISKLTEIDFGFGAMKSMDNLLKGLSNIIQDAKMQKKEKQEAILNIGEFFDTAKNIVTPIKYKNQIVSTDLVFKSNLIKVPLLKKPVLSNHLLASLDFNQIEVQENEVFDLFIKSLLSFKANDRFLFTFCENFLGFGKKLQENGPKLFSFVKKIEKLDKGWAKLMRTMIGLEHKLPKFIENEIAYIVSAFIKEAVKGNGVGTEIQTEKYPAFIEKTFQNNTKFRDSLLKSIIIHSEENFSYNSKTLDSFCLKFSILFQKTKKPLKPSLDKLCDNQFFSNPQIVSQEKFQNFLNSKVKLHCAISEIDEVWELLNPDLDNNVHVSVIFQQLRYMQFVHIAKKSVVRLIDFLQLCCEYLVGRWEESKKSIESALDETEIEMSRKVLSDSGIGVSDEGLRTALIRVCLGEDLDEVVDGCGFVVQEFGFCTGSPKGKVKKNK